MAIIASAGRLLVNVPVNIASRIGGSGQATTLPRYVVALSLLAQNDETNGTFSKCVDLILYPLLRQIRPVQDVLREAVRNGQEILELLIEGAREEGRPLPAPRLFARTA